MWRACGDLKGLANGRTDWVYLEKTQDVGHHDGLGGETGADHSRDRFVRDVTRRLSRLALVLGRVLQIEKRHTPLGLFNDGQQDGGDWPAAGPAFSKIKSQRRRSIAGEKLFSHDGKRSPSCFLAQEK